MKIAPPFAAFLMLFALATTGCDKKPADGATNELRSPTLVRGGVPDDGVKPVAPVARTGTNDDSIKPVSRTGNADDSIKPVARTGIPDDSIKPKPIVGPLPVKPVATPAPVKPVPVPTPR